MICIKSLLAKISIVFCAIILTVANSSPSFATLSDATLDYYTENHIYYYDPSNSNVECISGSLRNYAGSQVLTEHQYSLAKGHASTYNYNLDWLRQKAIEEGHPERTYDIPWQIFGALHFVEASLLLENPPSGLGVFGYGSWPAGQSISAIAYETEERSFTYFDLQIIELAKHIQNYYIESMGLNFHNNDNVKKFFFDLHDNSDKRYYDKAIEMDFTEEEAANGEGSVYVMNRYDARRDPYRNNKEMSRYWPGMYGPDGEWIEGDYDKDPLIGTTEAFGVYVVYEAFGGTGICTVTSGSHGSGNSSWDGSLIAGGMTKEQAQAFMEGFVNAMRSDPNECERFAGADSCSYGTEPGDNCVTFVQYFINKYTSINYKALPNGVGVVNRLANVFSLPTGNELRPYAVFSRDSPSSKWKGVGHTGIILGINEETNEVYVGQMFYGMGLDYGLAKITYSIDDFMKEITNTPPEGNYFVYLDSVLDQSALK